MNNNVIRGRMHSNLCIKHNAQNVGEIYHNCSSHNACYAYVNNDKHITDYKYIITTNLTCNAIPMPNLSQES